MAHESPESLKLNLTSSVRNGVFAIGSHSSVPDFGRWALGFKAVSSLWGSWILESIKGAVEKSVSVGARSINGIVDLAMSVERVEAWETSLS